MSNQHVHDRATRSAGYLRVIALTFAAAVLYGGWATVANASHGLATAARAGAVQGCSSAITTFIISGLAEAIFASTQTRWRLPLAAVVPPICSSSVHLAAHLLNRTPELLRTIFPSVVMGFVFSGIYAWRLDRGRNNA